jgi:hypothetical protein
VNDERFDFAPVIGRDGAREERVVRSVMRAVAARPAARRGLADAIVALGPGALAAAVALSLLVRIAPDPSGASVRPPTIGAALGMPAAAERVIRSPEPASGWELLTAFQESR